MLIIKQGKVGASLVFVGALLAGACAGGDGSGMSEEGWDESFDDGNAIDEAGVDGVDGEAAELDESSGEEEGLELGTLGQALGGSCGSTSSTLNSVFFYTTVPDHFPPDSAVAQLAAVAIGVPLGASAVCAGFGIADMHSTCDQHDACYGELGRLKSDCDNEARSSWERACKNEYGSIGAGDVALGFLTGGLTASVSIAEQTCREACLLQAQAMFAAISAAGQSAYDAAQADARRPVVDPQGPIFF